MSRCAGGRGGWIGWWRSIWIDPPPRLRRFGVAREVGEWRAPPEGMSEELWGGVEKKERPADVI